MDNASKKLAPGTLVNLKAEDDGTALGTGYFNPKSLIAVRLLARTKAKIDSDFFQEKLRRALRLREHFYSAPFYRLVHAEADGLPGLVIDRFSDVCVVQITTAGMERLIDVLLSALNAVIAPNTVILRNDAPARALEGLESYVRPVSGEAPARLRIEENGAVYFADPALGTEVGLVLRSAAEPRLHGRFGARQARARRLLLQRRLRRARGGAWRRSRRGSRLFEPALTLARESADANGVASRCRFAKADVFDELERLGRSSERYEMVICDPPPFAPSRKDLEAAARAYRKLARLAAVLVAPGGFLMLASCSHNVPAERFEAECRRRTCARRA
jgi:23S rRNA (cytosine1962-C5)-methyltransferase